MFSIRAYGRRELAQLYFPHISPNSAWRCLHQWINLNQEGTTVVMVTHSERDAGYAQRIINLLDGQVVPEVKL